MKFFVSPLGWLLLLMLLAIAFQIFGKRKTSGRLFLLSFVWLLLIATPFLPNAVESALENQYPKPFLLSDADSNVRYDILVLGSGHVYDPALAPNDQLEASGLARVTEGVRIWRLIPESRLILSGFHPDAPPSQAFVLAQTAMALGVPAEKIRLQQKPTITYEEAKEYRRLFAGDRKLIIVTSAYHMPRAMMLFRSQGLDPVPAPTFHLVKHPANGKKLLRPHPNNLFVMDKAVHEWIGLFYTKYWLLSREEKENARRFSR